MLLIAFRTDWISLKKTVKHLRWIFLINQLFAENIEKIHRRCLFGNCLSVFDHSVGLLLEGLIIFARKASSHMFDKILNKPLTFLSLLLLTLKMFLFVRNIWRFCGYYLFLYWINVLHNSFNFLIVDLEHVFDGRFTILLISNFLQERPLTSFFKTIFQNVS